MTTGTRVRNQIHMDDVVIDNQELEQQLEDREQAKQAVKAYRALDKKAKETIAKLDQQPPYRIGRFVVGKTETQSRSVSFETSPGTRISIKLLSDE